MNSFGKTTYLKFKNYMQALQLLLSAIATLSISSKDRTLFTYGKNERNYYGTQIENEMKTKFLLSQCNCGILEMLLDTSDPPLCQTEKNG